jgi:hypothetical protein
MKEVAARGFASRDVIDAAFVEDEKHSVPGEVSVRFKRSTAAPMRSKRTSIVTEVPIADGTPHHSIDDVFERRRRNSFRMVAEGTPHSQVTPLPADPEAAMIHAPPLREEITAELPPELLESLAGAGARKSRNTPPVGVETSAGPPPVVEPPRAMWPIFVGIAAGVLGIAAFLLVHYLL